MSHFSSSPAIASLDSFLTLLMVMITIVFSFYLTVMFTLSIVRTELRVYNAVGTEGFIVRMGFNQS
jgi:hypothetical protein